LTRRNPATLAAALWLLVTPAHALELGPPLACTPGEDCWLVRLVDHDPGPGFADHRCGTLGSDGHDGTDFAIEDSVRMAAGVPVLAAAAGVVVGIRDSMPDQPPQGRLVHDFGERNCGNGVLLRHGDGWETQYCHLRRSSIKVVHGNEVTVGQQLGLVGMSGEANFPHVHLTVRREGTAIDPFTGAPGAQACKEPGTPLWSHALRERLAYNEVPIAVVGLTDHVPERDAIVSGTAGVETLSAAAPALVGYVLVYGLRRGDRLEIAILGPDGSQVSEAGFDLDEEAPRHAGRRAVPAD
jgi:Peptidase family M23